MGSIPSRPTTTRTASAASCSPASGATSTARSRAPAHGSDTPRMLRMIDTLSLAEHGPVIPVIVLQKVEYAVPLAEALVAGGVKVLEVTLRTPVALRAIEAIANAVPQAVLGAGTLRNAADARAARAAGCVFGVSPGYTSAIGAACRDAQLSLLPGVSTASEVMAANDDGLRFLKFFPAVPAGGVAML